MGQPWVPFKRKPGAGNPGPGPGPGPGPWPLALALARPILGTRTNEKVPYGSFSFVSGQGFPKGWDPAVKPFKGFLRLPGLNC